MTRERICDSPEPHFNGHNCVGKRLEIKRMIIMLLFWKITFDSFFLACSMMQCDISNQIEFLNLKNNKYIKGSNLNYLKREGDTLVLRANKKAIESYKTLTHNSSW